MPDPTSLDLVSGAPAARQVLQDPFWATVLRRHDDVDLVVLPPESPDRTEVPAGEPRVDPDAARQELRARMAGLWAALGLDAEPARLDDVWFAGSAPGTLRWQGTATFDDLVVEASDHRLQFQPEEARERADGMCRLFVQRRLPQLRIQTSAALGGPRRLAALGVDHCHCKRRAYAI